MRGFTVSPRRHRSKRLDNLSIIRDASLLSINTNNRDTLKNNWVEENNKHESLGDILEDFAESSSIHGVRYLGNFGVKSGWITKCIWILTLILGFTCAGLMLQKFWSRFNNNPTRKLVDSLFAPLWTVPFPAVTVCLAEPPSFEKYLQDLDYSSLKSAASGSAMILSKYVTETTNSRKMTDDIYFNFLHTLLKRSYVSMTDLANTLSVPCKDVVESCWWQGSIMNCEKVFVRSYSYKGTCCSFNYFPEAEIARKRSLLRTDKFGSNSGLILIFKDNFFSYGSNNESMGFIDSLQVMIHHGYDYPSMESLSSRLERGKELHMQIRPIRNTLSPEVRSMNKKRRGCMLNHEASIEYFSRYSYSNCYVNCRIKTMIKICGCIPYYYEQMMKGNLDQVCNFNNISCINKNSQEIWVYMYSNGRNNTKPCFCPDLCEDTTYSFESTEFPIEHGRFATSLIYRNVSSENAILRVFMASQVITVENTSVVADAIYLLSSLGGIFSLFLGCSFLSVAEVLYFLGLLIRNLMTSSRVRRKSALSGDESYFIIKD